jgi:hypothetical protein
VVREAAVSLWALEAFEGLRVALGVLCLVLPQSCEAVADCVLAVSLHLATGDDDDDCSCTLSSVLSSSSSEHS